ncbi:hypothetical protein G6F37_013030 [Rhizopus arrhizus]|nr:hypothetical protein G6F38_012975 [Rhizopus arrhizus]KAG1140158.1 hypothetical protein G6F37_013030 [Rhizopus arrhizus]
MKSQFDQEYAKYWQDREKTAHNNKLEKRARALVGDVQERVIQRAKVSFGETDEVQTDAQDKNDTAEADVNRDPIIQKIIRDITDVPSCW